MSDSEFSQTSQSTQAERLAQLRRDKGMTAEQLAQAMTAAGAKVSRGAISNWERGTNGIVSSKLPTLARILGCSEGYLLRGDLQNDMDSVANSNQPINSYNKTNNHNKNETPRQQSVSPTSTANSQPNPMSGHSMNPIKKSDKLQNVCYDIRGPLLQTANKMEAEGKR
ncbi:MAG: helix-turn-helix domain-containing protein, partial [Gammaproteobacteria bacterium]|nr:helix-turn-helix domain-containing protein [Gammaproteobacteria bacterium]